ncbi:MAG: hypothetical protein LUQ38_08845 [Methanotrichaceae archaeon]|nr:hypothetical protein [Methanotrichaceae archaeon]
MFSEKDLVTRELGDMQQEVRNLLAESEHLRTECETAIEKEAELRRESVDARPEDPELAEMLWQEAENLHSGGRDMLRRSVEKRLRAAEVQHRIDIRIQIESLNNYDEIWRKSTRAGRT